MKYCLDCEKFLSSENCPTCGSVAVRRQSIFRKNNQENGNSRRLSTIQEEDPINDNISRVHDADPNSD